MLTFRFSVDTFSSYSLAGGMAKAFDDDSFLSLTARPSVLSSFFGVPRRLRNLAVQRCGSGF